MQLKIYQQTTLDRLNDYLRALRTEQNTAARIAQAVPGVDYEWDVKAWTKPGEFKYQPRMSGDGQRVPYVCLKVPTGGGKTLIAVRAIDAINSIYRGAQYGLVLWIVPTTQIYNQTLLALKDRAHPYRQQLNLASADRVKILEKDDLFSPLDMKENLCVLLLMLPSANRQNKETLRMFMDRGGFEQFFPTEDDYDAHSDMLGHVTNLDTYGTDDRLFKPVAKSSLGNTLRLIRPIVVLDEGHKAYGKLAQDTLFGFNPCFVLELTATPTDGLSNVLVRITGKDVLREGMIKLDLHIRNSASADWRDALRDSHLFREKLEQIAIGCEQDKGVYIRPINLIQVERTGKDQRDGKFIHAEDVRDFLITQCGVPKHHIAVKSSERDEIENIDLLSRDCPIRYIITKQALQEGWDCPFAYILTVLTNPHAATSITQLVGRVLRQPYAEKTGIPELDESYVFCFRNSSNALLLAVRKSLYDEGLEDLTNHLVVDDASTPSSAVDVSIRDKYINEVGKVYLPCFLIRDPYEGSRMISYEMDLLSRIEWSKMSLDKFTDGLALNPEHTANWSLRVGLENTIPDALQIEIAPDMPLDPVFITRQLNDIVPSPWQAYDYAKCTIDRLRERPYTDDQIRRDLAFIIEELKKEITRQRDEMAHTVFKNLIDSNDLQFVLIEGCPNTAIPNHIRVDSESRKLRNDRDEDIQRSLFDYRENEFNETEKQVALYIDGQDWIFWWHRNEPKAGYGVRGWRPQVVYTDFIALSKEFSTVYVLETKGLHLIGNEDTAYKRELFKICDDLCKPVPRTELPNELNDPHRVRFRIIDESEWRAVINALAQNSDA